MIPALCTAFLVGALLVLAGRIHPAHQRRRRPRSSAHPGTVVGAALACGGLTLVVTPVPVVVVLAAGVGATVPGLVQRRRDDRAQHLQAQAWPGLVDDMTSAVRAGLNLPEALAGAAGRAPLAMRPAFAVFRSRYGRTGDFAGSLEVMRAELADPVFDQLAQSLLVAREVGGTDLTQVLRSLGSFLRADLQIRGEVRARQSWTVNSARMAVAAPWVVLAMLSTRASTIAAYQSFPGAVILVCVAASSVTAYQAMLRIARIDGSAA